MFVHEALFYRSDEQYLASLVPFVRAGLDAEEPVLVVVPGGNLDLVRSGLGPDAERIRLLDMSGEGRNPSRIIPWVLCPFADQSPDRRVRVVGEPIWPGRSAAEYPACVQHEAMINDAFAGRHATILCPYDATRLQPAALLDAERTHPILVAAGERRASLRFQTPVEVAGSFNRPLPEPPPIAVSMMFTADTLARVRRTVQQEAAAAGLLDDRLAGFLLAVHEVATNSIAHGGGRGTLRIWPESGGLVCEVCDRGHLTDPLAGRLPAARESRSGRGLLFVHHVCDLVQIYTRPGATTIRLHLRGQDLSTAAS